jgi:hypothetical protein
LPQGEKIARSLPHDHHGEATHSHYKKHEQEQVGICGRALTVVSIIFLLSLLSSPAPNRPPFFPYWVSLSLSKMQKEQPDAASESQQQQPPAEEKEEEEAGVPEEEKPGAGGILDDGLPPLEPLPAIPAVPSADDEEAGGGSGGAEAGQEPEGEDGGAAKEKEGGGGDANGAASSSGWAVAADADAGTNPLVRPSKFLDADPLGPPVPSSPDGWSPAKHVRKISSKSAVTAKGKTAASSPSAPPAGGKKAKKPPAAAASAKKAAEAKKKPPAKHKSSVLGRKGRGKKAGKDAAGPAEAAEGGGGADAGASPARKRGAGSKGGEGGAAKKSKGGSGEDPGSPRRGHGKILEEGPPDEKLGDGLEWPAGWKRVVVQRQGGATAGSKDRYWYPPLSSGKAVRLRALTEVKKYLAALGESGGDEAAALQAAKRKQG